MNFTYESSVTSRQRAWFEEAMDLAAYEWDSIPVDVTVRTVTEPPCPGHTEFACTHEEGSTAVIAIRAGLDDPSSQFVAAWLHEPEAEVRRWFYEVMIHELGHVVSFFKLASDSDKAIAASYFQFDADPDPGHEAGRRGGLGDWNPLASSWEERVQEAVAEVFKDGFLAEEHRVWDNRTKWTLDCGDDFENLMLMLLAPVGGSDYNSNDLFRGESGTETPSHEEYVDGNSIFDNGAYAYLGASVKFPGSVPDGAGIGATLPDIDTTGSNCASHGGFNRADYRFLISCPAGHAPPAGSPNIWGFGSPTLDHPFVGGWPWLCYDLEQQGFTPHAMDHLTFETIDVWDGTGPLPYYHPEPDRDYYVYVMTLASCASSPGGFATFTMGQFGGPGEGWHVFASKLGAGEPPPPPACPYQSPDGDVRIDGAQGGRRRTRSRVVGRG